MNLCKRVGQVCYGDNGYYRVTGSKVGKVEACVGANGRVMCNESAELSKFTRVPEVIAETDIDVPLKKGNVIINGCKVYDIGNSDCRLIIFTLVNDKQQMNRTHISKWTFCLEKS